MIKFIKTSQFANTFYPNIPKYQKEANNKWLANMGKMSNMVVSPDASYPTLTKVEGGWEYESDHIKTNKELRKKHGLD